MYRLRRQSMKTALLCRMSLAALILVVVAGVAPSPAVAASAWSRLAQLSKPGADVGEVAVAIDAGGEAIAVWKLTTRHETVIQSSSRPPGGTWSAPAVISPRGGSGVHASRPRVAMSAAGEAVVLWTEVKIHNRTILSDVIQSSSRPPGGGWSQPVTISGGTTEPGSPEIAVDGTGAAVVVWEAQFRSGGPLSSIVESASRPPGGAWSAPVFLTPKKPAFAKPKLAIDGAGEAVAIWVHGNEGRHMIETASRPPEQGWSSPTVLSKGVDRSANPEIAIGDAGEALAVWEGGVTLDLPSVWSASRSTEGNWSSAARISPLAERINIVPQLAMNSGGAAVVVWTTLEGHDESILGAERLPGGNWSAHDRVYHAGSGLLFAEAGIDAAGEADVVIDRETFGQGAGATDTLRSTSRLFGGHWSPPRRFGVGELTEVDVNPEGQAVLVAERFVGHQFIIVAAVRPASP
jgi:hypothetical protein